MSASRRPRAGGWLWGVAILGCLGVAAGLMWHRGSSNPAAWLLSALPDDSPETQPDSLAKTAYVELPTQLRDVQTEPDIDEDDDADPALDLAGNAVVPAHFEEVRETAGPSAKPPARPVKSTQSIEGEPGASRSAPLLDLSKIESLESNGDLVAAQQELSRWYGQKPAERERILPRLNRMSKALYFSPQPHFYEPYVVQPSDQLRVIGQKYKLSWEYLAKLNNTDPRRIRPGQKLKVVPGPFAATINLSRYELTVYLSGSYVKSYRVGIGKDGTTPVGTFSVRNKMIDPTYYGPEGVIAHDDPQNPLGERWIDIGDSYGIHGTIDPASIGRSESRGCIRMLNPEVEEVYDFLVIGSEVKIER